MSTDFVLVPSTGRHTAWLKIAPKEQRTEGLFLHLSCQIRLMRCAYLNPVIWGVSGGWEGEVCLWDVRNPSGPSVRTYEADGHNYGSVTSLAMDLPRRHLYGGCYHRGIVCWDSGNIMLSKYRCRCVNPEYFAKTRLLTICSCMARRNTCSAQYPQCSDLPSSKLGMATNAHQVIFPSHKQHQVCCWLAQLDNVLAFASGMHECLEPLVQFTLCRSACPAVVGQSPQ